MITVRPVGVGLVESFTALATPSLPGPAFRLRSATAGWATWVMGDLVQMTLINGRAAIARHSVSRRSVAAAAGMGAPVKVATAAPVVVAAETLVSPRPAKARPAKERPVVKAPLVWSPRPVPVAVVVREAKVVTARLAMVEQVVLGLPQPSPVYRSPTRVAVAADVLMVALA